MKLEFTEEEIEEYQNAPGGPRAPVTHIMFDNLINENKKLNERINVLEGCIKDWHKIADQRSEEIIKQFERIKVLEDVINLKSALAEVK